MVSEVKKGWGFVSEGIGYFTLSALSSALYTLYFPLYTIELSLYTIINT